MTSDSAAENSQAHGVREPVIDDASTRCIWLAIVGVFGSVAVCSLYWRGWQVGGHTQNLIPAVATALTTVFLVHLSGQLPAGKTGLISALAAVCAVVGGKFLAWDLFGWAERFQHTEAAAISGWQSRLWWHWGRELRESGWINAASLCAAPILAAVAIPLCQRLEQMWSQFDPSEQIAEPAGGHSAVQTTTSWVTWLPLTGCLAWIGYATLTALIWPLPERQGFLLMTCPNVTANRENPLLGFAALVDGQPEMWETLPAQEQVTWFCGSVRSDNNFRFLRSGHAYLATAMTPWLGIAGGLIAVNFIAWWTSVVMAWKMAELWFADRLTSGLAALLTSLGCGFLLFLEATTPHLLSVTLFHVGLWLLAKHRWNEVRQPWRVHALLGLVIGCIGLVYNTSQMLLLIYLLGGIRRQRWIHLAGGLLLARLPTHLWSHMLPGLGINVENVEQQYLQLALKHWRNFAMSGVFPCLGQLGRYLLETITAAESPWIVLAGIVALLTALRRPQRELAMLTLLAPTMACVLFAPAATARGYIVYGMCLVWYLALARGIARGLRQTSWVRGAVALALCVGIGLQIAWDTAHRYGHPGPITTYFLGWDDSFPLFTNGPAEVVSLTGHEPTPRTYGGQATWKESGAVVTPGTRPVSRRQHILTYLSRAPFMVGSAGLCCAVFPMARRRRWAVGLVTALSLAVAECGYRAQQPEPAPFDLRHAVNLPAHEQLRYDIHLGTAARERLSTATDPDPLAWGFYVDHDPALTAEIRVGDRPVMFHPLSPRLYACDRDQLLAGLHTDATITLLLSNHGTETASVSGWQRLNLPDRQLQSQSPPQVLPLLELRAWDRKTGGLRWAGF